MSLIARLGVTLADLMPLDVDTKVFTYEFKQVRISGRLSREMNALATERNVSFHVIARELIKEIQMQ